MSIKLIYAKYSLYFNLAGGVIAGVPTVYAANEWYEHRIRTKIEREQHINNNDLRINLLVGKVDTVLYVQKLQIENQAILDGKLDTIRKMSLTVKNIVKEHIISQAKDKDAILKAVRDFGPYYNMNIEKKKTFYNQTLSYILNQ